MKRDEFYKMRLYRKILRFIFGIPKKELTWNVQDFKKAVSLLKRFDNPDDEKVSLWKSYKNPWFDSVDILHRANIIIRESQQR